ncbi:hypothetical protein ACFVJI_10295 [Streptomyces sp. NPDC127584]|uniref:hypothetical protein n=1 Tax=Streptomyces sp. NPDC127584 TaxID=3345403 RepID=UPI00362D2094
MRRRILIEAVVVVAAAPAVQAAWLGRYAVPPDEIALGFDDGFLLVGCLVEEEELSPAVLPLLRMIDEVFTEMTADAAPTDRWTTDALSGDAGWERARQLAREVLALEGEGDAPLPDIRIVR